MADAKPSNSGDVNADPKQEDKKKGKPQVKEVTSRAELKPDSESKFKILVDGSPDNPNYKKFKLPDGTIKEVR